MHILTALTILWLTFNLLFFWTNAIVDSYFYWAFGTYIQTGSYPFIAPFVYARPTTISPPLYGIIVLFLQFLPRPDVCIRIFQSILLVGSGILLYRILKHSVSDTTARIIACLFILIPGNIIYVNYLLTEILAQFFVILIASYLLIPTRQSVARSLLVTAVATLTKYSLIIYAFPAGLLMLYKKHWIRHAVYPAVACGVIAGWIFMNWHITGVVGLSDTKGIQLYNQAVWIGKIVPKESSKEMRRIRQYIPLSVDLRKAYWDLQGYILPSVQNSWPAVDRMLGAVAREAVREQPLSYTLNTLNIFVKLHGNSLPYWSNLANFGKPQNQYPLYCDKLGTFQMCTPLIRIPYQKSIWNAFIVLSGTFYSYIVPILSYLIFFPSLLAGLCSKERIWKGAVFLYLLGVIPIAMYVHPDTRYIIPFYPLYIIIVTYGVQAGFRATKKLWPANGRMDGGTER